MVQYKDFIPFEISIIHKGFEVIGYFPYERASIRGNVRVPSSLYSEISSRLDNKIVLVCKDTVNFGTQNFAIYFHDSSATIGTWKEVVGYTGEPLKLK